MDKDSRKKKLHDSIISYNFFLFQGKPIEIEKVEKIESAFNIESGNYTDGNLKFNGIARISINHLSQLYQFKGYAFETDDNITIKSAIIICKYH